MRMGSDSAIMVMLGGGRAVIGNGGMMGIEAAVIDNGVIMGDWYCWGNGVVVCVVM